MKIKKNEAFNLLFVITFANFIGKILGFLKDILISNYYGNSEITDAFILAMSIPTLILGIFTSSTDSLIIPQYTYISNKKDNKSADRTFSNVVNILSIIGIIVSCLIFIFPEFILQIFAPGFNGLQEKYAEHFLKIFSFTGYFHILYCFFCSYNTIKQKNIGRIVLAFSTNLIVISILSLNADKYMNNIALGYLIASIFSAGLPIVLSAKAGYRHKFSHTIDEDTKKIFKLFIPLIGTELLVDINVYIDKFIASGMEAGSISALNYASKITAIFDSVIVVGLGVVILPHLSKSFADNNTNKFIEYVCKTIKILLLTLLPIWLLMEFLSKDIITAIYMRGAFDYQSVLVVSDVFMCYASQILFVPLQFTFAKIFHSREDMRTPFFINIISAALNVGISVSLSYFIGLNGIALGTSISTIISCFLYCYCIKKTIGWDSNIIGKLDFLKVFFSCIMFLFLCNFVNSKLVDYNIWIRLFITSGLCISIYMLLLFLFYRRK